MREFAASAASTSGRLLSSGIRCGLKRAPDLIRRAGGPARAVRWLGLDGVSAEAVAELMARAGKDASGAMHDPRKWAVALRHSYAVAAIEVDGVLLGFARCVSGEILARSVAGIREAQLDDTRPVALADGVFSALVLDVTVDSQAAEDAEVASEALVRRLLKSRRRWGKRGPETFVVFARQGWRAMLPLLLRA